MPTTLYICYFGVNQPLVQTQVIPYLLELRKDGTDVLLLTFEPNMSDEWSAEDIQKHRRKMAAKGIEWYCLPYHKRLSALATAYDILRGTIKVRQLIASRRVDVLHGRVHVPTLIGALARKLSLRKPKLLFDIRGFFPEEYVDAGVWPEGGILFRTAKRVEGWLLKESDGFVILTNKALSILFPRSRDGMDEKGRPIEVIPCCVDLERFGPIDGDMHRKARETLGVENKFVVIYVGYVGGWYAEKEITEFLNELLLKRPDAYALMITRSPTGVVKSLLTQAGYDETNSYITAANFSEVPFYLSAADMAISLVKESYSKKATSPTKNAEYLSAGLPIVSNRGVGDVKELLEHYQVGAVLNDYSRESYRSAIDKILALGDVRERCREVAEEEFDLATVGGARYRRLYKRLLQGRDNPANG